MNKRHLTGLLALGAAASLALAGCSAPAGDGGTSTPGETSPGADKGTITLGFIPSWTDGLSTAYLLENQLEKLGYTVEMEELTEAGPLYVALADGAVDMYPSAWPEVTHKSYMEEYGDRIESLGAYYDGAVLTIAVPEYTDIDSIEDLAGNAGRFGGEIIGIEPGAGLTQQTQESMMPAYGLEGDYRLVTSSTAAMLTELGNAIDEKRDIVVTLWRPFWANAAYDIKDLADPLGAMGAPESLHFLGNEGFAERFPEAAALIAAIQLDDVQYGSLEQTVAVEHEDDPAAGVEAWLAEHGSQFDWVVTG